MTLSPRTSDRMPARNAKGQFTRDPHAAATRAQLQAWTRQLVEAQAVPLVVLGLGRARQNLGALYVLPPDDPTFDRATLRVLLRRALAELDMIRA